jgi:hypothetical protein
MQCKASIIMSVAAIDVSFGTMPVNTALSFPGGSSWVNMDGGGTGYTETVSVFDTVTTGWTGDGGTSYLIEGGAVSDSLGTTYAWSKLYVGAGTGLNVTDTFTFSFLDESGLPRPLNTPTGTAAQWSVTLSVVDPLQIIVEYLGPGATPTSLLWIAGDASATPVNIGGFTLADGNTHFGPQAFAGDATEPANCLSGCTVVSVVDPGTEEVTYAALHALKNPHVLVRALDATGAPCTVAATLVRTMAPPSMSKATALPAGVCAGAAASWSHVVLVPEGTARRKPVAHWRCRPCREAGVYGRSGACATCCPVPVAGYESVMACDADPAWMPPTVLHDQPWYHLVPDDVPGDANKAFCVGPTGSVLSEFYRTPLPVVLAGGQFQVATGAAMGLG